MDLQLLPARSDKPDNGYNEKFDINHDSIGTSWDGLQMFCDILIRWLLGAGGRVTRKAKTFSNGFRSSMYNYCITAKNALFNS